MGNMQLAATQLRVASKLKKDSSEDYGTGEGEQGPKKVFFGAFTTDWFADAGSYGIHILGKLYIKERRGL
jgi:hypothetical protein